MLLVCCFVAAGSALSVCQVLYSVTRAAPAAGQPGETAPLDKIAQMTRGGGFRDFGYGLVLRGTDAVLEASLAAIEQAVKHFDLLRR